MHYYSKNGKTITSSVPITGLQEISESEKSILENSKLVSSNIQVKLDECETEYNRRLNAGITYNSKVYDSDDKAQRFITSLVTALNAGLITKFDKFTLKDNSTVNLTGNDIKSLGGVLLSHVDECHQWKKAKQAEIQSCTTLDQIRAVTF